MQTTTIAAISTPLGSGGIGIVRISGSDAIRIAEALFRPRKDKRLCDAAGYTGMLGRVFDAQGDLDDAIAFVYRAPKSYTGEDVVELSCHGGVWAVQAVLRLCLAHGALPAAPGEFTKRAFLNGKLSLSQAEGVAQLISAQGNAAMRAALAARDGALSTEIDALVEKLLAQAAHLAAWVDYPEEEIETVESGALSAVLQDVRQTLCRLLATWDRGLLLREGVRTAIVGRPNVGKSTLMNLLAGHARSIVTDTPGTTRDVVEDQVRLGETVLLLSDTAGIRETSDPVESIGVARAQERIETADLVLAVFDSSDPLREDDLHLLELLRGKPCIAVVNKADLPTRLDLQAIRSALPVLVTISAATGSGRDALEEAVGKLLDLDTLDPTAAMVSSERQRQCLQAAEQALAQAETALCTGVTLDAVAVLVDAALDALLSLSGRRVSDAVVDAVFAQFCVGK